MTQDKIKFTSTIKQNYCMAFHNGEKQIGLLDFNGDAMKFEGDAEASAKVFFDCLATWFEKRLEEEREATKEKAEKVCKDYAEKCAEAEHWDAEDVALYLDSAIRSMKCL